MITDHCNLHTFVTTKNLTRREAGWWEQLSGLDLEIEYRLGKKNPADGPSQRPDYMDAGDDKELRILHTVGYVTRGSMKRGEARKAIKDARQAPQGSEATSGSDSDSESLLTDNESLPQDTDDDCADTSSTDGNDMPDSDSTVSRRTSSRQKRRESIKEIKKNLPRRKMKKLDETLLESKPMRLHLVKSDDEKAQVNREAANKIPEKESLFASPTLEMRQLLQALQMADHFAQTMKPRAIKAGPLAPSKEWEEKMPMSVKSGKSKRTMMWHAGDKLLCYKQRWYVPPGFLRRELLRQHHDDPWASQFGFRRTL